MRSVQGRQFLGRAMLVLLLAAGAALGSVGGLDPAFGVGGLAVTRGPFQPWGGIVLGDGRHLIAGTGINPAAPASLDLALTRLTASGAVDTTFGTNGTTYVDVSNRVEVGFSVARQSDGKLLVGGYTWDGTPGDGGGIDWVIARLSADGQPDPTFGTGGIVRTDISGHHDELYGLLVDATDRIVAVGTGPAVGTNYDMVAARYLPGGDLDPSFGGTGVVRIDFSAGDDLAYAAALTPQGLVMGGRADVDGFPSLGAVRLLDNGALDAEFGAGGRALIPNPPNTATDGRTLLVEPNGAVVLAGNFMNGADLDVTLARLTAAGVPDPGFGTNGRVILGGNGDQTAYSILRQPDGKLLISGHTTASGASDVLVARFDGAGAPDPLWGTGGVVIHPFPETSGASALRLVLQPDGRVVAHCAVAGLEVDAMGTARYLTELFDTAPPTVQLVASGIDDAGRGFLDFDVHDPACGLGILTTKNAVGCTLSATFAPGTTAPVRARVLQSSPTAPAIIEFNATDRVGLTTRTALRFAGLRLVGRKRRAALKLADLPRAVSRLTFRNGNPGFARLVARANRSRSQRASLTPGSVNTLDLSAGLIAGNANKLRCSVSGRPGASGVVLLTEP